MLDISFDVDVNALCENDSRVKLKIYINFVFAFRFVDAFRNIQERKQLCGLRNELNVSTILQCGSVQALLIL